MNRTQLSSLRSALGLTLKKSTPVEVPKDSNCTKGNHSIDDEDEIGPLTASPPVSPATRMSSSSASFFPATTNNNNHSVATRGGPKQLPLKDLNRIGSFAVHNLPKLRESKWFSEGEARIFCVVAEIGFIVEIRRKVEPSSGTEHKDGVKEYKSLFGVVTRKECINQSAEGVCKCLLERRSVLWFRGI